MLKSVGAIVVLFGSLGVHAEGFTKQEIVNQMRTYECVLTGLPANSLWRKFTADPNRRIVVQAKTTRDAMVKVSNAEAPMTVSENGTPLITIQGEVFGIDQIECN